MYVPALEVVKREDLSIVEADEKVYKLKIDNYNSVSSEIEYENENSNSFNSEDDKEFNGSL